MLDLSMNREADKPIFQGLEIFFGVRTPPERSVDSRPLAGVTKGSGNPQARGLFDIVEGSGAAAFKLRLISPSKGN